MAAEHVIKPCPCAENALATSTAIPIHRLGPTGVILATLLLAMCQGLAAQSVHFDPADIAAWETHSFSGQTEYRLTDLDGVAAVHARCDNSASGLFYRGGIDLNETPIIEWRWRVTRTYSGIDETTRAGDDYPARIYLVDESPILRWRTRALNYVWASTQPQGSDWPNAYASQARMIAVRSGIDAESVWHTERRNALEDFRRYHGRSPERIDAVAIMTDCDDSAQPGEAWYGEIRFLSE